MTSTANKTSSRHAFSTVLIIGSCFICCLTAVAAMQMSHRVVRPVSSPDFTPQRCECQYQYRTCHHAAALVKLG